MPISWHVWRTAGRVQVNACLDSGSRDEEPLVDTSVNGRRGKVIFLGDIGKLGLVHAFGGLLVGDISATSVLVSPEHKNHH